MNPALLIRINAVCPGPLDTPMSARPGESTADRDARIAAQLPAGRVGSLDEVGAAVLYLASPAAAFHVGTDLVLDGGSAAWAPRPGAAGLSPGGAARCTPSRRPPAPPR
jgi:NAD(P)-dependent dehydrogenase (short-subunit alcohol dehydrogenase family)